MDGKLKPSLEWPNCKELQNKLDEELSKQLEIKRICTTPYLPRRWVCFNVVLMSSVFTGKWSG